MSRRQPEKFKFKRHASIGAAAAEDDEKFLSSCFVNTGDLDVLLDCDSPERIVLGRTGIGKTALLNQLLQYNNTIRINPENLSFNFLTNSTILQFLIGTNVNLDLFFKLLWRHVFVVELLKTRYNITNKSDQESFLNRFASWFAKDKKKEKAIQYLMQFGDCFWEETEYRVKEITNKFEEGLKSSIGSQFEVVKLGVEGSEVLSSEEKIEVGHRAQRVINDIQMKELSNILEFLNEDVFNDVKQCYFICIDKLDENWVDDKFRNLLIRSLIETIREFQKVRNIKIIIGLRTDLIDRVFRQTRDGGFQEEKYRSLYLPLKWNNSQLKTLLDKRVDRLISESYTSATVTAKKYLPNVINKTSTVDYMIHRTLMRPRELIEFFNLCIEQAEGRATINKETFLKAEAIYSRNRLRSLQDEWFSDYPKLIEFTELIKKKTKQFKVKILDENQVLEFCVNYAIRFPTYSDYLSEKAKAVAECNPKDSKKFIDDFLKALFQVFYRVGIVGVKVESYEELQWSFSGALTISASIIDGETSIQIHPTFWRVLGITSLQQ